MRRTFSCSQCWTARSARAGSVRVLEWQQCVARQTAQHVLSFTVSYSVSPARDPDAIGVCSHGLSVRHLLGKAQRFSAVAADALQGTLLLARKGWVHWSRTVSTGSPAPSKTSSAGWSSTSQIQVRLNPTVGHSSQCRCTRGHSLARSISAIARPISHPKRWLDRQPAHF